MTQIEIAISILVTAVGLHALCLALALSGVVQALAELGKVLKGIADKDHE